MSFSLRKKAIGVYFNDADVICSVQVTRKHEGDPNHKLVSSIKASRDVFFCLYGTYSIPAELLSRLKSVVAEIETVLKREKAEAEDQTATAE